MATKQQYNTQLAAIQSNNTFTPQVEAAAKSAVETGYANNATLLGQETNQIVGGVKSLETKIDDPGSIVSKGDAVTTLTEDVAGTGSLLDPETVQMNFGTPGVNPNILGFDSDALAAIDSSGAIDGIFSDVDTIGGSVANSISTIITLITGLGTLKKLTNIANGGSAVESLKAGSESITSKADELTGSIKSAVDNVASISEATELQGAINSFNNAVLDVGSVVQEVSAIATLNPNTATLEDVSNFTGNKGLIGEVANAINEVDKTVTQIENEINTGINAVLSPISQAVNELNGFIAGTDIVTGGGLLQDIAESFTREASAIINQLAFGAEFSDAKTSELLQQAISGDPEQQSRAIKEIVQSSTANSSEMQRVIDSVVESQQAKNTSEFIDEIRVKARANGISEAEIENTVNRVRFVEEKIVSLDTTISGSIVKTPIDFYREDTSLAENTQRFNGQETAFSAFTYIDSKEELGSDIRKIVREVSEVVVHASETFTNSNIGSEELHVLHNEKGFDGIQYHYVIRRDGRLQRGRPPDKISEASKVRGHDERSLDIVLIGGLNCPSGTENPLDFRSAQSFTRAQMATLEAFLYAFYRRYPGGQVFGHNDILPSVQDPYFDVVAYVNTLFRKRSVYEDLQEDTAYEPADLIQQRPV